MSSLLSPPSPPQCSDGIYTEVGSAINIGTAVGVFVTFVVSFSLGVLVASVLCYISRRSTGTSYKPSSHADPAGVYNEVGTNKMTENAVEMDTNVAYGSRIS